jgi:hypothetical protein
MNSATKMLNPEQNAIDRLRQSREELAKRLRSVGEAAGRSFVLEDRGADAMCLRRLERADSLDPEFGCFHDLATILCGDNGAEREWQEQLKRKYGDEIEEPECIEGFLRGALEKFHELEAKL